MKTLKALVRRNSRMFFKDKGIFFTSLITPIILLVLYATFLAKVYKTTFLSVLPETVTLPDRLVNGFVSGQLFSSLLAVSCVTVAFCANMLMVQDKVTGARKDLLISPLKKSTLALGYYVASAFVSLIISLVASAVCFIYVAATGWYLSAGDVALILLDAFLLVMFGTALSSVINFFLSSQGQISAVGTIVSSGYGFICGAYMPISSFGEGLRNVIMFLPGTYGTSLVRNHTLGGVLKEMQKEGVAAEAIEGIKNGFDCNLYFFGDKVEVWAMYLVLCLSVLVLVGAYVLINRLCAKTKN